MSATDQEQRRIIGGELHQWLSGVAPMVFTDRQVLAKVRPASPASVIVFASDPPGLVAAAEILGPDHDMVLYLTAGEYRKFTRRNPDPEFFHHVLHSSHFGLEPEGLRRDDPVFTDDLGPDDEVWVHKVATMWGPLAGRGESHLWKWDGTAATLLREGWAGWIS